MRCADPAKALLDAADHHVADHLAGDAGGIGGPNDDLAIVAINAEPGVSDRILTAVTKAYDGNVQMIDSASVRVHQHGAD